jgi:hypothetical protein
MINIQSTLRTAPILYKNIAILNLVFAIPKCLQIHENKIIYQSKTTFLIMLLHSHGWHVSTLFSKSSSGPFLRYRSLLPTLKMHYGIPNAYNFGIMILYRCMFHQFYYLDTVHILYVFKNINNWSYFISILLKYVKYTTYNIVFPIVVNYLKLYKI